MGYKSIEEQKQPARNTNELLDHLRRIIEQNDERFSFEWLVGGETLQWRFLIKKRKSVTLLRLSRLNMMKMEKL